MTDFRALCTELLSAMDTLYKQSVTTSYSQTIEINGIRHAIPIGKDILAQDAVYADLLDRTRAALAQPEPQGPTNEELKQMFHANDTLSKHCEAGTDWSEPLMMKYEFPAVARAVLARWGRPTSEENLDA
jgi:hypothetical protein